MRFSIQTPQYQTDLPALIETWRAAERLGFRSAWLMDHTVAMLERAAAEIVPELAERSDAR